MAAGGLSDAGLARLHDVMAGHVEGGAMPGLTYLLARGDDVHVEAIGTKTFGDSDPMPRDAIFRIASLSKPITSAAAMILVDDGTIALDAAVDDLLPELADRQVLRSLESELDDTVPAHRAITVDDLHTCRMGFGVVMAWPGTYPIQRADSERALMTMGPPWPPTPHTPDEWMQQLGRLPLIHQPGESWLYNTGIQVLGVLIERAAGMPLADFMSKRIFAPLGMSDTGFNIGASQRDRMTTAYTPDPNSGELSVLDGVDGYWSAPPTFPNAAGWLVSTLDDYWAFAQLILNRGESKGSRILSEQSVELMTTNQLTDDQRASASMFLGQDAGWGFGMATPLAGRQASGVPRGFGWNGGTGTTWRSDPDTGLTGILFTQRAMASPETPREFVDFWDLAYASLDA
jgi:CubicO group peptidase (beta-lactamase class C family)